MSGATVVTTGSGGGAGGGVGGGAGGGAGGGGGGYGLKVVHPAHLTSQNVNGVAQYEENTIHKVRSACGKLRGGGGGGVGVEQGVEQQTYRKLRNHILSLSVNSMVKIKQLPL